VALENDQLGHISLNLLCLSCGYWAQVRWKGRHGKQGL